MDPKVRNRTTDELSVRKKEFLKICDILDELKINYFFALFKKFFSKRWPLSVAILSG